MEYLTPIKSSLNYLHRFGDDFDARHAHSILKIFDSVIQVGQKFDYFEEGYKQASENLKTISMFSGAYAFVQDVVQMVPTYAFLEETFERISRGTVWKDLKHGTTIEKVLIVSLPCIKISVDWLNMNSFFQHIGLKDDVKIFNIVFSKDDTTVKGLKISNNLIRSVAYVGMAAISIYTTKGKLKTASSISTIASCAIGMTQYNDKAVYFRLAASVLGYTDTLIKI